MKVHGLVWAGVRTDRFEETVRFFRDVLGMPLVDAGTDFAWSELPDSSKFEVFGPHDSDHDHFDSGPVPEFLVDDVAEAAAELEAAGVTLLGPPRRSGDESWLHFRAPDGNVYGLTSSPSYRRRAAGGGE
jgi:catechol 2,3-dioxygenase-like lactoylglutathione lyase family enzyme